MAKMTLLDMTQNILSAMDSDYVNSIGDSVEADQIAVVIKETYFDLISSVLKLPEHKEIINLTGLGDTAHPNYLKLPDSVMEIDFFRYDKQTLIDTDLNYQDIDFLEPRVFQNRFNGRTESDSNTVAISDFAAGKLLVENDKHPDFWTTFDDLHIVCDSFDSAVDSTLQQSKTFCYGLTEPTWTHDDNFIPDMDSYKFTLLLEEAKSTCFINFKQVTNVKSERKARRQLTSGQNKLHRRKVDNLGRQPDFGRSGGGQLRSKHDA